MSYCLSNKNILFDWQLLFDDFYFEVFFKMEVPTDSFQTLKDIKSRINKHGRKKSDDIFIIAKYDTILGFPIFAGLRNTEHRVFSLFLTFNSEVRLSHETLKWSRGLLEICAGQEKDLFCAGGTVWSIFLVEVIMYIFDAK